MQYNTLSVYPKEHGKIITLSPGLGDYPRFQDRIEDFSVQELISQLSVE
jgi:hypothetical protein